MRIAELVRKHPILAGGASVLGFVIVGIPAWLSTVWPLLSTRLFVDVAAEYGVQWLAMVGPLYGWAVVSLGAALIGLFAWLIVEVRAKEATAPPPRLPPLRPAASTTTPILANVQVPKAKSLALPKPIPSEQIRIELKEKAGSWFLWLWNEKAEDKTGVSVWLMRVDYYSPELEQGRGGFVPWRDLNSQGPFQIKKARVGAFDGKLLYDSPVWIEVIRAAPASLHNTTAGRAFQLRHTANRLAVEVRWDTHITKLVIVTNVLPGGVVATATLETP